MTDNGVVADLVQHQADKQLSLMEAMERYELVGANYDPAGGTYIVMADRDPKMSTSLALQELGYSSPSPYTSWTRDERIWALRDKQGIRTYYDMKRADGTVRGALRLLKTPVMAGRWFVEPASDSALDRNIAKFVEDNLFEELNVPWTRFIEDALLMCDYGYIVFEKVFKQDMDGKIKLTKLAPRHPLDIRGFHYDDNGGPAGISMEPTEANGFNPIEIPIEKLVIFVLEQEAGDLRGISILRSAYKHYYMKDTLYKIDAIQKERHGIGVPIIKLPMGFSSDDRSTADNLGRNLRTNERAHVVLPAGWDLLFAKLEGQPVDCMSSIKHHDDRIMTNILAPFYDDANTKEDSMNMFYKSTRYIGSTVADTTNRYVIKQLVDYNYNRGQYPKLRVRRIGETEDLRTLSFAVRNFVGAGMVTPDDKLESFIRRELDLPPADPATARAQLTPQNPNDQEDNEPDNEDDTQDKKKAGIPNQPKPPEPARVGPPRQSTKVAVGPPRGNAGTDRSGGK